jgi:hypothetical protein
MIKQGTQIMRMLPEALTLFNRMIKEEGRCGWNRGVHELLVVLVSCPFTIRMSKCTECLQLYRVFFIRHSVHIAVYECTR